MSFLSCVVLIAFFSFFLVGLREKKDSRWGTLRLAFGRTKSGAKAGDGAENRKEISGKRREKKRK